MSAGHLVHFCTVMQACTTAVDHFLVAFFMSAQVGEVIEQSTIDQALLPSSAF
jgi:hypothetical protein